MIIFLTIVCFLNLALLLCLARVVYKILDVKPVVEEQKIMKISVPYDQIPQNFDGFNNRPTSNWDGVSSQNDE